MMPQAAAEKAFLSEGRAVRELSCRSVLRGFVSLVAAKALPAHRP
jgi:hypothetical protein